MCFDKYRRRGINSKQEVQERRGWAIVSTPGLIALNFFCRSWRIKTPSPAYHVSMRPALHGPKNVALRGSMLDIAPLRWTGILMQCELFFPGGFEVPGGVYTIQGYHNQKNVYSCRQMFPTIMSKALPATSVLTTTLLFDDSVRHLDRWSPVHLRLRSLIRRLWHHSCLHPLLVFQSHSHYTTFRKS